MISRVVMVILFSGVLGLGLYYFIGPFFVDPHWGHHDCLGFVPL